MNIPNIISKLNGNINDRIVRKQEIVTKLCRFVNKLEELTECVEEKEEKYHSLEKINSKIRSNVTELEVINESQQIEKIHLKQNVKNIKKNIKQTNISVERLKSLDGNNEKYEKQLMKLTMLKRSFKFYFDEKSPPHIVKGLVGDISSTSIEPFEFNCTKMDHKEIADNIFENLGKMSEFKEAWEKLFDAKTLIHTGSTSAEEL